ncbi:ribbon-helix-helix protein, CopG family [Halorubrum sp. FL23]|uniref:ribbon-helix-helix protein, CopG family n=1 Tax=Halorubrum sp. FL23 TaxID=3458704 RepID=UPI004034A13D
MEPITLRLPSDLLETLDTEAEDVGFSSRSEYIRHLLQNRDKIVSATLIETDQTTSGIEDLEQLGELSRQVSDLEERLASLEGDVDEIRSAPAEGRSSSGSSAPSEPQDSGGSPTEAVSPSLEQWLEDQGPQSEDARSIILEAARILEEEGRLSASELRERLYEQYPDTYSSAGTLWSSTIERFYKEAPGFGRPEYGTYAFDGENFEE